MNYLENGVPSTNDGGVQTTDLATKYISIIQIIVDKLGCS